MDKYVYVLLSKIYLFEIDFIVDVVLAKVETNLVIREIPSKSFPGCFEI